MLISRKQSYGLYKSSLTYSVKFQPTRRIFNQFTALFNESAFPINFTFKIRVFEGFSSFMQKNFTVVEKFLSGENHYRLSLPQTEYLSKFLQKNKHEVTKIRNGIFVKLKPDLSQFKFTKRMLKYFFEFVCFQSLCLRVIF